MAQLMPLPLTVSCSSKLQIGFTYLVPAYPGCPGKEAVKWLYGCSASFVWACKFFITEFALDLQSNHALVCILIVAYLFLTFVF